VTITAVPEPTKLALLAAAGLAALAARRRNSPRASCPRNRPEPCSSLVKTWLGSPWLRHRITISD